MAVNRIWQKPVLALAGSSKKNEDILLKFYKDTAKRLKRLIIEATAKGNSIYYLEQLQAEAQREIALLESRFATYSKNAVVYSYKGGILKQEEQYKQLKLNFEPVTATEYAAFGGLHKDAIKVLAENTYKPLRQVTTLIGRDVKEFLRRENFKDSQTLLKSLGKFVDSKTIRELGIEGVKGIVVGDTAWQKAARQLEKEFVKKDIFKIPYYSKDGKVKCMVSAQDYSKMVARTTSAQAFREGTKNSILETFEGDLVEITGISSYPNSPCIPFQGKILSLEGKTDGYTTIADAEAAGLFHPNCIHDFSVTSEVIKEYEDNNIDY